MSRISTLGENGEPRVKPLAIIALGLWALSGTAHADFATPPFTQTMLKVDGEIWGVSIGPGGPDVEFGSEATNGGLYRITETNGPAELTLSDGKGLRNPTGLVEQGGTVFIVDGAELIAINRAREVLWRTSYDGAFFYDIETMSDGRLVLTDFGNGRLVLADPATGAFEPFPDAVSLPGIARIAVADDVIYGAGWGSDEAFDGTVYRIAQSGGAWRSEIHASGFGNPEAVELVDGGLLVGSYRGHETAPTGRLFKVEDDTLGVLEIDREVQGASDFARFGDELWISLFLQSELHAVDARSIGSE